VGGEVMVACCDADMLGRMLGDGKLMVHVSERFYGGETVDEDGFLELADEASVVNIIGDRAVDAAVRRGLVDGESVLEVCGVKHAQVYKV